MLFDFVTIKLEKNQQLQTSNLKQFWNLELFTFIFLLLPFNLLS